MVSGADEALRALAAKLPDIAIVDLALSDGQTGPQLIRALSILRIPVIVCTGYNPEHARTMLRDLPVAAVLSKPVHPDDLLAAVRLALRTSD